MPSQLEARDVELYAHRAVGGSALTLYLLEVFLSFKGLVFFSPRVFFAFSALLQLLKISFPEQVCFVPSGVARLTCIQAHGWEVSQLPR